MPQVAAGVVVAGTTLAVTAVEDEAVTGVTVTFGVLLAGAVVWVDADAAGDWLK